MSYTQIGRLKNRLKNIDRSVKEYRMTITEAKELLSEIELLEEEIRRKPKEIEVKVIQEKSTRILDGGNFL